MVCGSSQDAKGRVAAASRAGFLCRRGGESDGEIESLSQGKSVGSFFS